MYEPYITLWTVAFFFLAMKFLQTPLTPANGSSKFYIETPSSFRDIQADVNYVEEKDSLYTPNTDITTFSFG